MIRFLFIMVVVFVLAFEAKAAAPAFRFTVNMSEAVNITTTGGTPRIALDVGGQTRYASYTSGTGTAALTFTYTATVGDLDLDGIGISSPIELNGGAIADLAGNAIDAGDLAFTPPDTSNVNISYPSLSMDFTSGSTGRYSYNGTVYNSFSAFASAASVTFTNDGNGTYFDSSGVLQQGSPNTPRFDHDPVTLEPKGILIEEARTNLIKNSEDFTLGGQWVAYCATPVFTTGHASPDGGNNAMSWNASQTNGCGSALGGLRVGGATPSVIYTISIWVRASAPVNLNLGTDDGKTSSINVTTQWQRFTKTATTGSNNRLFQLYDAVSDDIDVYVWGAQVEEGDFVTSYIPTSGSTVTRAADVFYLSNVDSAGWYNASAGTLLMQYYRQFSTDSGNPRAFSFSDDTTSNRLDVYHSASSDLILTNVSGGSASANLSLGSLNLTTANTFSVGYAVNDIAASRDGGSVANDTSNALPVSITHLGIGTLSPSYSRYLNGHVSEFKYYPARVQDTQLQLLSTP